MRCWWAGSLSVCVGMLTAGARAQDAPSGSAAPVSSASVAPVASTVPAPLPVASAPPLPAAGPAAALGVPTAPSPIAQTSFQPSDIAPAQFRGDPLDGPAARGQIPDGTYPPPAPAPGLPPPGLAAPPPGAATYPMPNEELYNRGAVLDPPQGTSFWDRTVTWFDNGKCLGTFSNPPSRCLFQSDHAFDYFSSPISNPFLFEDPRALTEIRPIFMTQGTPGTNWVFGGGGVNFLGAQARVAITDRISLVINKFGFIWTDPRDGIPGFDPHTGLSETWLSPKYTFIRNESTRTVAAFGWMFQIPTGPAKVFQNTGSLSNTPYVSIAQNFWETEYGAMNAMGTTGYSFDPSNVRSEYYYLSAHLDYDVMRAHAYYPTIEMNFTDYTRAGTASNLGFEGGDLFNFGSQGVSGRKYLNIAPGFRWVFLKGENNSSAQTGVALQLPVVGTRDLQQYRVTWDFIFRY